MTDDIPRDPIRELAHDSATDAVPVGVTGEPDFDGWCAAVGDVAAAIEHTLRSEVPA
jgi:hypothetical protein